MEHASLEILRRQYFSLLPPRLINLPPPAVLSSTCGQAFLVERLLQSSPEPQIDQPRIDRAVKLQEPENGYKRLFWRRIVQAVEDGLDQDDAEAEVHEALYETLAELMAIPTSTASEPPPSHRSFVYDIAPPSIEGAQPIEAERPDPAGKGSGAKTKTITLLEEQTVLQGGTTGLRTWTAALRLGAHILTHPHLLFPTIPPSAPTTSKAQDHNALKGHSFVELGAGTGFLAVLLAQLGAKVIATDLDVKLEGSGAMPMGEDAVERQAPLDRLQGNIALNTERDTPRHPIRAEALDWFDSYKPFSEQPRVWRDLRPRTGDASSPADGTIDGPELTRTANTVIAADVIYDPDLVPALVHTIRTLIAPSSAEQVPRPQQGQAVIAATVRNVDTLDLFERVCNDKGLQVEQLDLPPLDMTQPIFWDSGLDAGSEVRIMRMVPVHRLEYPPTAG